MQDHKSLLSSVPACFHSREFLSSPVCLSWYGSAFNINTLSPSHQPPVSTPLYPFSSSTSSNKDGDPPSFIVTLLFVRVGFFSTDSQKCFMDIWHVGHGPLILFLSLLTTCLLPLCRAFGLYSLSQFGWRVMGQWDNVLPDICTPAHHKATWLSWGALCCPPVHTVALQMSHFSTSWFCS